MFYELVRTIQYNWSERRRKAHKTNELKMCNEYTLSNAHTHTHTVRVSVRNIFSVLWCYEIGRCVRWWCRSGLSKVVTLILSIYIFIFICGHMNLSLLLFSLFCLVLSFCLLSSQHTVGLSLFAFSEIPNTTVNGSVCIQLHVICRLFSLADNCMRPHWSSARNDVFVFWQFK